MPLLLLTHQEWYIGSFPAQTSFSFSMKGMCLRGGATRGVVMMGGGVLLGMVQKFLLRIYFDPCLVFA